MLLLSSYIKLNLNYLNIFKDHFSTFEIQKTFLSLLCDFGVLYQTFVFKNAGIPFACTSSLADGEQSSRLAHTFSSWHNSKQAKTNPFFLPEKLKSKV